MTKHAARGLTVKRVVIPALVWLMLLAFALPPAAAQTTLVTNPTTLVFTPSADHDVRLPDGRLKVASYRFDVYSVGASAPFQSTDLGRPTPGSDGSITYNFSSAMAAWPLPGGNYEARVAAVGPEGIAASTPSNPFTFASSCAYSVSATSASAPAAGGTAQVGVTTTTACAWTASASLSWVTLSAAGGTGSGTITITVAANTSTSSRTGTVTVAGQPVTITQAGATPCSYTLSSTSASVAAGGGSTPVNVATTAACAWTATESLSWVSLGATGGTGNGSVTMTVAANTTTSARTGVVTIAGQAFTITQAGATPCSYTLSGTSASVPAAGGTTQVGVTAGSSCAWTVTESLSWVSLSTSGGTGSGSVTMTVAANTSTTARSGVVTVAGQAFTVTQPGAGASCSYTLSGTSASVPAAGGGTQVSVTTTSACAWTASENLSWVSLSTGGATGSGTVVMTVAANGSTARTGTVTVAGQAFTITQAGTTASTGLPAPWQNRDIGSVGIAGSSSYSSGIYTVTGSGADIWGTADSFQYAYQPLNGNGQIVARVTSMQNTHYYAKAGVMLRESLAANSPQVLVDVMPNGTVELLSRSAAGGSTASLASGVTQGMPAWLRLARDGATVTAAVSADGTTWRTVGTVTVSMGSSAQVGLAVTSHNTGTRNTATFDNVSVGALPSPPAIALPSPWQTQDIGTAPLTGSATYSSGTFAVSGAGADIWGTADSFRYAFQQLSGDGEIVARLVGQQNTATYAFAGVMLRSGLTPGASNAMLGVFPGGGIEFNSRSSDGGSTTTIAGGAEAAPAWLRLQRTGSAITASVSSNGTTWRTVGTATFSPGTDPYVGLAVTSHNPAARNTATFDSVTVVR